MTWKKDDKQFLFHKKNSIIHKSPFQLPGCGDVYLDKYVVVLHQQGVVVDFAEELSSHHFIRTVLDEAGNVQVTCSDTREQARKNGYLW